MAFEEKDLTVITEAVSAAVKDVVTEAVKPIMETAKKEVPIEGDNRKLAVEYAKAVLAGDTATLKRIDTEIREKQILAGTASAGGYLVPEDLRAEIWRIIPKYGVVRKAGARVLPVKTITTKVPTLGSAVSMSWVDENTAITATHPVFAEKTLTAKKIAGISVWSREFAASAVVDPLDLLSTLYAEAWAKAEDQTILVGKTADGYPWDGILYNSNTPTVTMSSGKTSFSDVTLDNLYDLIDKVPAEVEDGSVFILHKNILTYLRKLKDNEGRYILIPQNKTLLGYPYFTSSVMPSASDSAANTPFILFGNFNYVQIGVLQEMATDLLKEGTVNVGGTDISLAQKDMFGVRVVGMWGWVFLPNAFAALKTAAS